MAKATYALMIKPGEEIHGSGGERLRVLDIVPFKEEDESPFIGLLQVEEAQATWLASLAWLAIRCQ